MRFSTSEKLPQTDGCMSSSPEQAGDDAAPARVAAAQPAIAQEVAEPERPPMPAFLQLSDEGIY